MWRDDRGRPMELGLAGGGNSPPAPQTFVATDMADAFVKFCVNTQGQQAGVSEVANDEGLQVSISDIAVARKASPSDMLIASGPGLVVSQTDQVLEYDFTQCNVNFFVDSLPENETVEAALTVALGGAPDNETDRVKKNGKPNKGYKPEWRVTGDDGTVFVLQFNVMKSNRYLIGDRVLFGLREVVEK